MPRHYASLFFATTLLFGCADTSRTPAPVAASPLQLTESDVGVIVTNMALQRGVRLRDYQSPSMRFDTKKRVWWFHYQLKPPGKPGGHFTITVDETGQAQFFGGA